jgi:uncharacterized membrane protein YedE/YeeE
MIERCPWYLAGPLLGLLIVALRAAINKPLGALGGYIELSENVLRPSRWGFRVYLLLGIVVGGALFTLLAQARGGAWPSSNPFNTWSGHPASAALLLGAGLLMGFGARTAGGCTSGHGMCGTSLGSRASITSSMTFFIVAVALTQLLAHIGGMP